MVETARKRGAAVTALRKALRAQDLPEPNFPSIVRFLAATPAKLLAIALEDVLGEREQVNIPGTIGEHPNWRRKLPRELESFRDDAQLREIARAAVDSGRAAGSSASRKPGTGTAA